MQTSRSSARSCGIAGSHSASPPYIGEAGTNKTVRAVFFGKNLVTLDGVSVPTACPDCYPAPVTHWVERLSVAFDWCNQTLFAPLSWVSRRVSARANPAGSSQWILRLMQFLAFLKLARFVPARVPVKSMRTQCLLEAAQARGILVEEFRLFGLSRDIFVARRGSAVSIFQGLPRPAGPDSAALAWMDNKALMRRHFAAAGIPVARGGVCFTTRCARRTFASIEKPAVVKPHLGSYSRHTTVHVSSDGELARAFAKAKVLSPLVIVEEELPGTVFRITLVNRRVAGIIAREQPHVVGDGAHTIREFVAIENENPIRQRGIFYPIPLDAHATDELVRQLKIGGRLIVPVGNSIWKIDRVSQTETRHEEYAGFSFVSLVTHK